MNREALEDHPGWQWCTSEGAEQHTLLMGLRSSFREKIEWLEEAENLTIAMRAGREKLRAANEATSTSETIKPSAPFPQFPDTLPLRQPAADELGEDDAGGNERDAR